MLKKIINQLEEAKYCKHDFYQNGIDQAISIIKQHEKENSNRVDKVLRISPSREQIAMVNDEGITEIFIRQDVVISQYQHQLLSPEDIERAASKYAFENNTHRSNSKAFIAGANFAKQPIANEVDEPIYCNCETPTLGKSITRCGTCDNWFKPLPHTPKK